MKVGVFLGTQHPADADIRREFENHVELVRAIRDNIVTFITPVIEVDGREKQVDRYYFNKERPDGEAELAGASGHSR